MFAATGLIEGLCETKISMEVEAENDITKHLPLKRIWKQKGEEERFAVAESFHPITFATVELWSLGKRSGECLRLNS